MHPYRIGRGPGYQRPPQVLHGRAPVEIMLLLGLGKTRRERRKASEEATGTAEGEMHSHKHEYLKCRNDWKGERAGRHDGAKESRCTVPTENKMKRE